MSVVIKLLILLMFIYLVNSKVGFEYEKFEAPNLNLLYLSIGLILVSCATIISSMRWNEILRAISIKCRVKAIVNYTYIGMYFNVFFLGDMGGDLVKTYCVAKDNHKNILRVTPTVILDRVIGFATMMLVPAILIIFVEIDVALEVYGREVDVESMVYLFLVSVFISLFILFKIPHLSGFVEINIIKKETVRKNLRKVMDALNDLSGNVVMFYRAVLWSALSQIILYIGGYYLAISVVDTVQFFSWMVFYPIIVVLSSAPITFSGLGLREYLFVIFSGLMGIVSGEEAVIISVVILLSMLSQSIIGAIIYSLFRGREDLKRINSKRGT